MLKLSDKWGPRLVNQPETGMDYQVVTIILKDGRKFKQAIHSGGFVTKIRGYDTIPFSEDETEDIVATHDKWDKEKTIK
jgi:hypothetical protein